MYALITGASGGLGEAYARHLAAQGHDLVLVARSQDKLQALAGELSAAHSVQVRVHCEDLGVDGAGRALAAELQSQGVEVDVLVNNAGFGTMGEFSQLDPDRVHSEITLNCVTLTDLCSTFVPAMVRRGEGTIINVASTAAFQPIPTMAVYAATKSYVLSFSQALWAEVKAQGVKVVAICPGPTETSFFSNAGDDSAMTRRRTPEQVVASTFRALEQGRPSVVDGRLNAVQATVAKLSPTRISLPIAKLAVRSTKKA
ncbi:MAG TPA: SDR family oxidoreductase [Candidatus Luteococcus avicola]|nr:SDR family oxidoreductase [Candidatus Luteococcus avicola]